MKKLVFAALAIVAMAACTKSNVQYEQPGEISLQPVTQKATKATSISTSYPTGEKFNVWAWWGSEEAESSSFGSPILYIDEGTFAKKGNSWGGAPTPYYWPTTGSLLFAGYSPAEAQGTFKYVLNTETFTATQFIQPFHISETVDLMWFDVIDESYDKTTMPDTGVPATFNHALAWLTFKFNLENDAPDNWRVKEVTLTGIENVSTFTAVKGQAPSWTTPTPTGDGRMNVYTNATGVTIAKTTDGTVLENTADASIEKGAVLVIPQSCTKDDASLEITYDLKNPAYKEGIDNGATEYLFGQKVVLPLNGNNVGDAWNVGTHYIYNIVFGANEILIAPEVTAWDPKVNQDITFQ